MLKSADNSCRHCCWSRVRSSSYLSPTSLRWWACLKKACLSSSESNTRRMGRGPFLFKFGQYVPSRSCLQAKPSLMQPSSMLHLPNNDWNAANPWSSSSAASGTLYRITLSCLFCLSKASACWSSSQNLCLCLLSESSASASRFSKSLQVGDGAGSLAGEVIASLKLFAGVLFFVGDAAGGILLESCDWAMSEPLVPRSKRRSSAAIWL